MKKSLSHVTLKRYLTEQGQLLDDVTLSYQIFGQPLHTAPVILVNHALTGNSNVAGLQGWWKTVVGPGLGVDTDNFTIISINVLGNGYDDRIVDDFKQFSVRDNANLFILLLDQIGVNHLHAIIGGSIGGAIAWEMAVAQSDLADIVVPIASHWETSDWIKGQCHIQNLILNHSVNPLADARQAAMMFYRTPESINGKFGSVKHKGSQDVKSWLNYHGKALTERFKPEAYQMMNHLLATNDLVKNREDIESVFLSIQSEIVQIGIDSDLFFTASENKSTQKLLSDLGLKNEYHEIVSIHGHDAFLIEHEQLNKILKRVLAKNTILKTAQ